MGKNIIISGYYGFKNFGDEAILSVLINKLQTEDNKITVITSNPQYTKSQYKNIECIYTFDLKNIIKRIFTTDLVISGGGSLLQDATSLKSLLYYLFIIFLGIIFRKKVIIFAQGIGPIKNPIGKFITMFLLNHCYYVSVRDEQSHMLLKQHDISSDLLCDPIFSIKIPNIAQKNKVIAVQLRNYKGISENFINQLAHSICTNFPGYEVEIYSFQDEIDTTMCQRLEHNINIIDPSVKTHLNKNLTNKEIIEGISKAEYLIAMRFHAIIVGILAKCNVLAINYDIKVAKLAKEFELPMINFSEETKEQFKQLKSENSELNYEKAIKKEFDWSCFDTAIKF